MEQIRREDEIEYAVSPAIKQSEIVEFVQKIWQEIVGGDSLPTQLHNAAAQPTALPFKLKRVQGPDPLSAALIVLGSTIALDVWEQIILPRLKEKFGSKSFTARP